MATEQDLDAIRESVLAQADKAHRRVNLLLAVTVAVEGVLLLLYLGLMNFNEKLHWLVLIAAFLVYWTLAAGLFTLGAYVRALTLRMLKALELK